MAKKRENKKFRVKKRKVVFSKGPIHLVDCDVRTPSGRILSRQVLEHPGSVVMVPRRDKKHIILIRQFRFAAGSDLWELPAGGIEEHESMRAAASRELAEETGFRPRKMRKLLSFFPTPGISGEIMHLFLAEDLYPSTAEQDEDEEIICRTFPVTQIFSMIRNGRITDAKTILAMYYLKDQGLV